MKKKLFFLAVAAVAFASCSNDETIASQANSQANEISFRPLMQNVTRATSLNKTSLETNGFYVTATFTSGHTSYFADQLYKQKTAVPECWAPYTGTAFTAIYWPSTGADILDFHAYAPSQTDNAQLSVSNTNVATLNGCPEYTITPATAAASQMDFLYASAPGKDSQDGSLPLTFAHKESQISIQLKNTDANLKFSVDEVAVCNIKSTGVFKYRTTPSVGMAWGDQSTPTTYTQSSLNLTYNGSVDATAAGTSWILVPQALANPTTTGQYTSNTTGDGYNGAYIRVKLKAQSTYNNYYFAGAEGDNWVYAIWPISTTESAQTWVAGTHYTYTIDLKGGGYFETNQETPSGATLDRVLNMNEITFATVTVSDWTPSSGTVIFP